MASKIRLLSEYTVNRIAAGEVIESPASLIKELIENSVDAGAQKIVVEVEGGGLQKIRVSDDGCGMSNEDAHLSLQRYATSKIRDADDLLEIATMGFRGEALASIAAVSKMTLQTAEEAGEGIEIEAASGEVLRSGPCGKAKGTIIEVRNLFFNTPARKAFQKSAPLLLAEITKTVSTLSLANPFIRFELYHLEKQVFKGIPLQKQDPLGALKIRAREVLGEEFLKGAVAVEGSFSSCSFRGLIGAFSNTRPNRSLQYQFVNGRVVSCPIISYAVKDALGTRIEEKRFPIYVLHLDIDKDCVDVNVHPRKEEIRLRQERLFKQGLTSSLECALIKASSPLSSEKPAPHLLSEKTFFSRPEPTGEKNLSVVEFRKEAPGEPVFPTEERPEVIGLYEEFLWVDAATVRLESGPERGILIVDLKKAASRILFDGLYTQEKSREKQLLFLPLPVECPISEIPKIESLIEEVEKMGFSLEIQRSGFLVNAIPPCLGEIEAVEFLKDYLCLEERTSFVSYAKEKKLAAVCSKVSSQKRPKYTPMSALALFKNLLKSSCPTVCPSGEKIINIVEKDGIRKLFFAK